MSDKTISKGRSRILREVGVLAAIGLLVFTGTFFLREYQDLKEQNRRLSKLAFEPNLGSYVPEISAVTIRGDTLGLGRLGQRQLIFFYNSTCPHCRASIPAWNRITGALKKDTVVHILGVSFDEAEEAESYATDRGILFPVLPMPEPRTASLYRINSVPSLILLNGDGRIVYTRIGPLETELAVDSVFAAVERLSPLGQGGL